MKSNSSKGSQKHPASYQDTEGEKVVIRKSVSIKAFTPEEELKYLVERGDWELVLTSSAFRQRSSEGRAQLIRDAIDNRMNQLGKTLNYLVNRGAEYHAAAMGVLQRLDQVRRVRDEILKKIYEQYPRAISDKGGVKIDF